MGGGWGKDERIAREARRLEGWESVTTREGRLMTWVCRRETSGAGLSVLEVLLRNSG